MTIIIPIAGESHFIDSDYYYPKPLIDINDKPLIQYVIESLNLIENNIKFCFVLLESICNEFNLDKTLLQIVPTCTIVKLKSKTKGSLCSVLMTTGVISVDEEIIIANSDQIFKSSLSPVITKFRNDNLDAGIVTFESVHPRWSFAIIDNDNNVLETAEKRAISKNAIAGIYYFKNFKTFLLGAFDSVLNEDYYNDQIYISSSINQLILKNKKIKSHKIKNDDFISFYTPQKINEFERFINGK
jgi:dTDP-glucose pyrophosphorylase